MSYNTEPNNKKRKLNMVINTDLIPSNFDNYNYTIRYYRRKFNRSYNFDHLRWWGKCKICNNHTYKYNTNKYNTNKYNTNKYYINYYCKDCKPNIQKKNEELYL